MKKYVTNISNLTKKYEGKKLHKKASSYLKKIGTIDFFIETLNNNLKSNDFFNKKWSMYEMPYLVIYKDEEIELRFNLFFPTAEKDFNSVSHLIHHHENSILSTYVVDGSGYQTIEFDKNFVLHSDGTAKLNKIKDIRLNKGQSNIVDILSPHVISNVLTPTLTLNLWTFESDNVTDKERAHFFINNGNYNYVFENTFLENSRSIIDANMPIDHEKAFCYYIQKYKLDHSIIQGFLKNRKLNKRWEKYLFGILNNEVINYPIYNCKSLTLGNEFTFEELRLLNKI